MRISIVLVSAFLALSSVSSATAGQFFTNETAFVNAIQPNYYLEDFTNFTTGSPLDGSQATYSAPGANGFGWTASASFGLFANASALSVNNANDPLTITFTSNIVMAVGGKVANTDKDGGLIPGTVTITTSDGASNSIVFATATQGFLGYTTTVPITSITLNASSGIVNNWIQLDHFYTGVPNTNTVPIIINQLILLNGSNRLDAINLPVGNSIIVETSTNLQTWSTNSTVSVTNSTQTIFVPSTINPVLFYRLHL